MSEREAGAAREITELLRAWRGGDADAANRLFPLVYDELRRLARRELRRSGNKRPLDTTSLVHEACVRLVDRARTDIHDRNHFFALASTVMRHVVVDQARERMAAKRGGGREPVSLEEDAAFVDSRVDDVLAIDSALQKLQALDPALVQIVEMRFFGGLTVEETAEALGVSARTIRREWSKARALLLVELGPGSP